MSILQRFPKLAEAIASYPTPAFTLKYGTAGFRDKAEKLPTAMFRVGLLTAVRSAYTGQAVGVTITASHNAEADNGAKICDGLGDMLESSWEQHATDIANCAVEGLATHLDALIAQLGVDMGKKKLVFVGRDTRSHSLGLVELVIKGVEALGGEVCDVGVVTTPQLHWTVRSHTLGEPKGEEDYYAMLHKGFTRLLATADRPVAGLAVTVDGANGVGAPKFKRLSEVLAGVLTIEVRNTGEGEGGLNAGCGSEHVQKEQRLPCGMDAVADAGKVLASVDGDADRLVLYYIDGDGKFCLLDGDKIASLAAHFLTRQLQCLGLTASLDVVQTAYANGASTRYLNRLGMCAPCVPTGVKHAHHKAVEFDVGIYFEANGHGTVVFKHSFVAQLRELQASFAASPPTAEKACALERLLAMVQLINQAVGDAISDLLMVIAILFVDNLSLPAWNAFYSDLPSRQLKIAVRDRTMVTTADAERICVSPAGLQDAINELVAQTASGRAFVRPSGTEDVVRVYAEGDTQEAADGLANAVAAAATKMLA